MPGDVCSLSALHVSLLHVSPNLDFVPRPFESHRVFGAGFLLLALLLMAESLAGGVWFRSRVRMMIFPVTLILLGQGMVVVTFIETQARLAHLAMGLPMIVGGWAEWRHRLGELSRRQVDTFLVPALILASIETGVFHITPPVTSPVSLAHGALALSALLVAAMRLYQGFNATSLSRAMAVNLALMLVGVILFVDAFYQT